MKYEYGCRTESVRLNTIIAFLPIPVFSSHLEFMMWGHQIFN